MNKKNLVCLDRVSDISSYREVKESIERILNPLATRISIRKGGSVVIKVNLCLLKGPETGATVDPLVAKAVVGWLSDRYDPRQIFIAEADATHLSADMAFRILGWEDYFQGFENVKLLNLSRDEIVQVPASGGLGFSRTMMEADVLISLAKLKTHTSEKISCAMKNQFGALSEKFKIKYHSSLAKTICQAVKARNPDICVVDGLIAMEGNGPTNGTPRPTQVLIGGDDAYSVDHFCAGLMGFNASTVPHLRVWEKEMGGDPNYTVRKSNGIPANFRFVFLPRWKSVIKGGIELLRKGKGGDQINEEA